MRGTSNLLHFSMADHAVSVDSVGVTVLLAGNIFLLITVTNCLRIHLLSAVSWEKPFSETKRRQAK